MNTLLSTRLFASTPLDDAPLHLARKSGFLALELLATPGHFDLLTPGRSEEVRELVGAMGMQAPWVHLDLPLVAELADPAKLALLTPALLSLQAKVVVLPKRPWLHDHLPTPDMHELLVKTQQAGAYLALDFSTAKDRPLQHPPRGVGLCWDLALPLATEEEDRLLVEQVLEIVPRGHLQGVRIARLEDGHRSPPEEREAQLLEDAWPHLVPRNMVYDVEDPSGGRSQAEIRRVLAELHAFHSGERRPPDGRRGGLFWAGMAPG